ncbi:MAG: hypothetical protein SAJ37_15910 [Oscillatoria sp. PMC 1068.18]|nr:hypothetical protein [Oscillatoria sp. PMC 1076.18]MEC4990218.1 hypothetical protein [Oscillatoria sp. PMC 1068.18]
MEPLGHVHNAIAYEERVAPLQIEPLRVPRNFKMKKMTSLAAVGAILVFGGFTTVVASSVTTYNISSVQQQPANF